MYICIKYLYVYLFNITCDMHLKLAEDHTSSTLRLRAVGGRGEGGESKMMMRYTLHVTGHTSYVARHMLQVTWNRGTRHMEQVTRQTSHVTRHTSNVTRHTSHVTRHTSHVTRHTSHVTPTTAHIHCATTRSS